jgi:hypothetical protein
MKNPHSEGTALQAGGPNWRTVVLIGSVRA